MYKVSVVGIDNTGKTSVVRALNRAEGVEAIYLTKYNNSSSSAVRACGNLVSGLAQFGEHHELKQLAGAAYFLHLVPYFIEQRAKKSCPLVVSDRDPIVDTLCYLQVYHSSYAAKAIRPALKPLLEHTFNYPDLFFYLEASPEVALNRSSHQNQMHGTQLHEKLEDLIRLRELFDKEMFRAEKESIGVVRINTDISSLEEAIEMVKHELKRRIPDLFRHIS